MSSMMREDWIECTLDEVCEINMGQSPPSSTYNSEKKGLPFFQGKAEFTDLYPVVRKWCTKPTRIANEGDILLSVRAPVGSTNIANQECAIGRGLAAISYPYSNKIIWFYLKAIEQQLDKQGTGTTFRAVSGSVVRKQIFPLAPLPIQRAIVSKIEALFSDLDNGIANFKKAQEQLKIYRQAVLKKAFEGELTKEWREQQRTDAINRVSTALPTAEVLLKQIKEERQNHYNHQIEDWKKAVKEWEKNGKKEKKPSKPAQPKELPPLKKEELEELPILPVGWAWCRNLNVSTKITDGEHITPKREKSGYYLLSARNIQNGYISYTNVDYVGEDEYLRIRKRCNPEFGDILISCSGSVGRISLVPKKSNFVMVRSVALVKTNVKIYNPKFLEYLFLSPILQSQIEDGKKATAQANLFLEPIGKLNVILCSLQEQTQIIQEIESRLSVCDKMEQSLKESIEKAAALRQSILKKAFEGKLLSQAEIELCKKETDYEPASELLKKIMNEKLAKELEKKKPTVKKKSQK